MVEHTGQLIDRVGPERVADLRPVERDTDGREIRSRPGIDGPVVGQIGEVGETVDRTPTRRIEQFGHL